MIRYFFIFTLIISVIACGGYRSLPLVKTPADWKTQTISRTPSDDSGDPSAGFQYLITGDYIGSGVPMDIFPEGMTNRSVDPVLQRSGINENLPHIVTAFKAANGVPVMNGNCFTCHAGQIGDEVILGLGNPFSDFTNNLTPAAKILDLGVQLKFGKNSPEWEAYESFSQYFEAIGPYIQTAKVGVNPAARLAEACAMYRDPEDLSYTYNPTYPMHRYTLASDVPPLWNVKKKNALYYTAVGRGDFSKLIFQASVLGIPDTVAARKAVTNFVDVVAWLKNLTPPPFPGETDPTLAAKGAIIFDQHCAKCHGTYGAEESYPNKVVSLSLIGTDPYYASYAVEAPIVEWYNKSWFATSSPTSWFEPVAGYIAPPLDGIWATAPYLHNGSVPNLWTLLKSSERPTRWDRNPQTAEYDYELLGWKVTDSEGNSKFSYDTDLPGYGNQGHTFGDQLENYERKAVIEYLKTL
jgi:mono/diheme cytochrome c family protein